MTPDEGRQLWQQTLVSVTEETPYSAVLHHVIESVMIDIIEKRIQLSDTFAVTIGERIAFLNNALAENAP
jgi:hypothetical protein